ncbi:2,3-diaminopropionate biosynthesis protein SbnA [Salinispora pacifica]|uniref:2,3-diaminopropionate biosynthesis protein SbnA n=1 Tax=Salinispora pacifica TaxID=351187 RepID=UPI0018DEE8E6|nr:2,3-diaminopropionate biosynthesis protein SbnA [Salinispora pacifica]
MLGAIGDTPLVQLERLLPGPGPGIYAKMESFNPGGSIKDRSAAGMLLDRIRSGELGPRSVVVESSSGNLAIGLAQICRYYGLRFICVVDARTTQRNRSILRALGAEVEIVEQPDPHTGELLPVRLARVRELAASIPYAYWPNQYANPLNSRVHEHTMREIVEALDGRVDYLFAAVSSCGTLRGCSDYIRRSGLNTRIVAVDAVGSAIFGNPVMPRLIPGHGAAVRPELATATMADEVVHISDLECVVSCRRLIQRESVLAGGSSGAVVAALEQYAPRIPADANVALIFPDSGTGYLDTIYSDEWVTSHFGEISHLWNSKEPITFPAYQEAL